MQSLCIHSIIGSMIHVNCIVSTGAHRARVQHGSGRNNRLTWRRWLGVDATGRARRGEPLI